VIIFLYLSGRNLSLPRGIETAETLVLNIDEEYETNSFLKIISTTQLSRQVLDAELDLAI
jgi:hypothetical protein